MADDHNPEFVGLNPPKVFISYSHEDEKWKDMLVENLKILINKNIIDCWHDGRIYGGEKHSEKIFEAINNSKVAILLVSQKFLISDYIQNKEVPKIQEREALGLIHIYPIMIKYCSWDKFDWLKETNIRPKNAVPLASMDENSIDNEFVKIINEIEDICNKINNDDFRRSEIKYNTAVDEPNDKFFRNYEFVECSIDRKETAALITNIGLMDLGRNGEPLYNHDKKSKYKKIGQERREFYRKKEKLIQGTRSHYDAVPQKSSAIPRIEINTSEYFKNLLNSKKFYDLDLLILTPLIENIIVEYNIEEIIIFYVEASFQHTENEFIAHIVKKMLCYKYGFDETKVKVEPVPIADEEEKTFSRYKNEIEKIPHNTDSIFFSLLGDAYRHNTSAILQAIDIFPTKIKLILELNQKNKVFVYDAYKGTHESIIKSTSFEEELKYIQNKEILHCILKSKIKIVEKLIEEENISLNKSEYQFTKGIFLNDLGNLLLEMKLTSKAKESLEEALNIFRQLPIDFPEKTQYVSPEYRYRNAKILFNYGISCLEDNNIECAKSNFEESLEYSEELLICFPNNFVFQSLLLEAIKKLIEIHLEIGEDPINKKECLTHALELCRKYNKFDSVRNLKDNRETVLEYKLKACLNLSSIKIKESNKKDALEIYEKCIASVEKLKSNESNERLIRLFNLICCYLQGKKTLSQAVGSNPPNFILIEKSINLFSNAIDIFKGNEYSELANEVSEKARICFQVYSLFINFKKTLNTEYEFKSNIYSNAEKNDLMFSFIDKFPNELDITIKSYLENIVKLWSETDPKKRKEELAAINTSIEEIEQINFRKIMRIIFDEAKEVLMAIPTNKINT